MLNAIGYPQGSLLSPVSPFSPVSSLSRFRPPAGPAASSLALPADVVQISDLARSLLARDPATVGATGQTQRLDLHLDLKELGLNVDAAGGYDARGHSLSLDLHVSSRTGVLDLGDRKVQFQELNIEIEAEQVDTRATGKVSARPLDMLADGLKGLIGTLHDQAVPDDEGKLSLFSREIAALRVLLGDHADQLDGFLQRIVAALRAMGGQPESTLAPAEAGTYEYRRETTHLEIHSLSATFAEPAATAAGGEDAPPAAQPVA